MPTSDDTVDFNLLFSLRKPKDARAGLASGVKSVAKGVLAGAVGLIAAPAIGATQDGIRGFAKGAAAGIAGAVLLPVTGVAVGAAQVVRGIANTPEAVREGSSGKQWDEAQRQWINAPDTALIVNDNTNHLPSLIRGTDDYYALLGVVKSASSEEIKRAYYLAARKMHPDKNPGDPAAHARFQALSQAYQILGNDELRRRYDSHGLGGVDVNFIDGAEFFAALFGSDRFEHLVGELMLATAARSGPDLTADGLRRAQTEREAQLVLALTERLRSWIEGDESRFLAAATSEAVELVKTSYGERMLQVIGRAYETSASVVLGGVLEGSLTSLRAQGRALRGQLRVAGLAVQAYQAQQNISALEAQADRARRAAEDGRLQGSEDQAELAGAALAAQAQRVAAEEASLPLMLDAMWAANALDIDSTLRRVCRKVLTDSTVSKAHRRRRAEGLLELGRIFRAARGSSENVTEALSAKDRMEAAMRSVVEKRMQA